MKAFLVFITFAVLIFGVLAAPTEDGPQCRAFCTMEFRPVCGYDGACYKQFPNPCSLDYEKCTKRADLRTVDMSGCELAAEKNQGDHTLCTE